MNFKHIDIHSHLNLPEFDGDREEVIAEMASFGIATITVGVDLATSQSAVELAQKYEHLYACVGMHPNDNKEEAFDREAYLHLARHEKVVAIGETGLDYYRGADKEEQERQRQLFMAQIEIALAVSKPLMIHARPSQGSMDAYLETLEILRQYKEDHPALQANFHFFVGDREVARQVVELGFTVSFDGPITFTDAYDDVIQFLPIESVMVETDSPFASPVPYRGKRCKPTYVAEVVKKIAAVKNMSLEDASAKLLANTKRAFDI